MLVSFPDGLIHTVNICIQVRFEVTLLRLILSKLFRAMTNTLTS